MDATYSWNLMDGEPIEWYERFTSFYLPLGPTRTLTQAYLIEQSIRNPQKFETEEDVKANTAPFEWSKVAEQWNWLLRAAEYDTFRYSDGGIIELARTKLKNSALDAANALYNNLTNPRLAVQAAKEILDRAGLPATTHINVSSTRFSADDLAAAKEELDQWQKETKNADKKSSG